MKKEIKYFKKDNAGRSMTEMLGVLAVIGVLSVGGITGYKLAMNHYAANQIAYEINMLRTDAKVKIAQGAKELTFDEPYHSGHLRYDSAYGFEGYCFSEGDVESESCANASGYEFKLSEIPGSICPILEQLLINMGGKVDVNPTSEGEESSECQEESNTIYVAFEAERFGITGGEEEEPCNSETCEGECTESGCVPCEEMNKHWNGNSCVSCTNGEWIGNQCVCPAEKPYWEEATGMCKTCYEAFGESKPKWDSGTSECIPCEDGTRWNIQTNTCADAGKCESNKDCGEGEYCYLKWGYYCNQEFDSSKGFGIGYDSDNKGECHKVSDDLPTERQIKLENSAGENITYYGSGIPMTWWSACRLCAANAGESDSVCASPENDSALTFMAGYEDLECADPINVGTSEDYGYCHETKEGNTDYKEKNISDVVGELSAMFGGDYCLWLKNNHSSCTACSVTLSHGHVTDHTRNGDPYYALCR